MISRYAFSCSRGRFRIANWNQILMDDAARPTCSFLAIFAHYPLPSLSLSPSSRSAPGWAPHPRSPITDRICAAFGLADRVSEARRSSAWYPTVVDPVHQQIISFPPQSSLTRSLLRAPFCLFAYTPNGRVRYGTMTLCSGARS